MFKKNKIMYMLFGVAIIFATRCTKEDQETFSTTTATVVQVKYACGPACDALGFIIKINANNWFTPIDLELAFHINNLPVKIRYKKTGKLPSPFTAPNYELIEILQISR